MKEQHKPFIVIGGTPRSGTYYMSRVLRACGLDVRHESVGEDGSVGHPCLSTKSMTYGVCLEMAGKRPIVHLHQVRNPFRVIESIMRRYTLGPWGERTLSDGDEELDKLYHWNNDDSLLLRAMKMWYYMNTSPSIQGCPVYRIESLEEIWHPWLKKILQLECDLPRPRDASNSSRQPGTPYPELNSLNLFMEDEKLAGKILALAKSYGYCSPEKGIANV